MTDFRKHPDPSQWDDYVDFESKSWPKKDRKHYWIIPSICFNCESACGILAYVDKETLEVRKIEGNPVHPGSRGRTCAKGVVTPNQLEDPDRILYPLKRVGPRGERRVGARDVGRGARRHRRRASARPSSRDRRHEVMYHVGRPGEDGYVNRVLQAWGLDGHNSHTNVCSSSARLGHFLWTGADRPSPDHANARTILLLSSHLESGHYFNPHAQRIIEGQSKGATLIVIDPRLSNTSAKSDLWLPANPGTEGALLLAIARRPDRDAALQPRVRPALGELGHVSRGVPARSRRARSRRSSAALLEEYAQFTPEFAEARDRRVRGENHPGRGRDRQRRHGVLDAQLARRGRRSSLGLADHALPVPARRADGRGRRARRREPARHQQVRPEAPESAAGARLLERAAVPEGVPARVLRDELPAAALPQGRPRQARRLLHARLQPALDQSRRLHVDGSAARRVEDRPAHRADADLERDGVVRRLRAADGARHRAARHDEPGDARRPLARLPPAGQARGAREARRAGRDIRRRPIPAKCGKRASSGSRSRGRSIPTARSASASSSSRPTGPASRSPSTSTTAGCSSTQCPDFPKRRARRISRRCSTCASTARSRWTTTPTARRTSRPSRPAASRSTASAAPASTRRRRRLEFYSPTLAQWGWPEHAIPRYSTGHVYWRDLDRAANEFDLLPNFRLPTLIHTRSPVKWAVRDLARQSAVDLDRRRREARRRRRRSRQGAHRHRLLHHPRLGHRRHPPRRRRHVASPRALAAERIAGRHRATRPRSCSITRDGDRALRDAPDPRRAAVREQGSRQRAHLVARGRRPPEHHLPRAAGSGQRHALLASAREGREGRGRPIATATSWSTPTRRIGCIGNGSRRTRPAPGPDGTRRPMWFDRPLRPKPEAYKIGQ